MSFMNDIHDWWTGGPRLRPVRATDEADRDALARDIGLSRDTVERIAARGPQAGQELHRMLAALRLDPGAVKLREPLLMRDMSATCSTCLSVRACRKHLDRGVARAVYQHSCPNAASLAMLEAQDR